MLHDRISRQKASGRAGVCAVGRYQLCPKPGEATARRQPGESSRRKDRESETQSPKSQKPSALNPCLAECISSLKLLSTSTWSWGTGSASRSRTAPASSSPGASSATFITWTDLDSGVQADGQHAGQVSTKLSTRATANVIQRTGQNCKFGKTANTQLTVL